MTMPPSEIERWRLEMGLSVAEAARRLPCSDRTWRYWETGERTPPEFLDRALRDMERELAIERGRE